MFQIKKKRTNNAFWEEVTNSHKLPIILKCPPRSKQPRIVWFILLTFSAVWSAVVVGVVFIVVLPEMNYYVTREQVVLCAGLFWIALVLSVTYHIKHLNAVESIELRQDALYVQLIDKTSHSYNLGEISIRRQNVKNFDDSSPIKNNHFKLIIKKSHKNIKYDIIVSDEREFFEFLFIAEKLILSYRGLY